MQTAIAITCRECDSDDVATDEMIYKAPPMSGDHAEIFWQHFCRECDHEWAEDQI